MTHLQIDELCNFAHTADKQTRSDLAGGYIVNENDYTSNFTGELRRIINSNSHTGLSASSYLLSPPDERLSGCDAAIVITSNGHFKIATFEAKYPRISQLAYAWDHIQKSTGLSHFSSQLDRQRRFARIHAIFEMFYCELPFGMQPGYMQGEVSSCVWHEDAVQFDSSRSAPQTTWLSNDLVGLLQARNFPIEDILREVCRCSRGEARPSFGGIQDIAREFSLFGHVLHVAA